MPRAEDAGYPTDVPYVRQFCKELSPALLRAAAALNGFAPPSGDDFDYCELGCATGDTSNTLAAAYPRARFVGVDLSPEHVAQARGLASRGGLGNVRYLDADLSRLGEADLPACDYVVAHGVLSWIAPEMRAAMLDRAARALKPGGVLYVSYNALPGWAAVEPLRRLLRDLSAAAEGSILERAHHATLAARLLRDSGAEYFASNPAAAEMLSTAERMGPNYAVHEYLGEHWHPMYFADVASQMAARGLSFIGQLPLYANYRDLTIPLTAMDLFQQVRDRATFESLKDFAVNEFFRGDLYVKGGAGRDPATTSAYLDETPFGTLVPADGVKREVRLRHHALHYDEPPFAAVIAALAVRPSTVPELARAPGLASHDSGLVRSVVMRLLLGEQVWPMQVGVTGDAAAYNRAVLDQPLSPTSPVVLAAPVAGTGIVVPASHAVSLRLLTGVAPADRRAWTEAFVAKQPVKLSMQGEPVDGVDAQVRVLLREMEKVRESRLPKLVQLGAFAGEQVA
jgi:SAM-dependent methyltransferase